MSNRQTRHTYRSRLDTPIPSSAKRFKKDDHSSSSSSAAESEGEDWSTKVDGEDIKQSHFGEKRSRSRYARTKNMKAKKGSGKMRRRGKRVKSESIDVDPKEAPEGEAGAKEENAETQEEEPIQEEIEETNLKTEQEDQGNQAELDLDIDIENENDNENENENEKPEVQESNIRRSGRATKIPHRFYEDGFKPFGAFANTSNSTTVSGSRKRLKEPRGVPSSREVREKSPSPDPIGLFSDDHIQDPDQGQDIIMGSTPDQTNPSKSWNADHPTSYGNTSPVKPKATKPRKSALKPKTPSGPRKKKSTVMFDESKNRIRRIKVISSTSSDIGRSPGPISTSVLGRGRGRGRGPKKFGVRSRKTQPVFGVSPEGTKAVIKYEYIVSSDSDSDSDETNSDNDNDNGNEVDRVEFKQWLKSRKEMRDTNDSLFLLSLATRIVTPPPDSSGFTRSTTQPIFKNWSPRPLPFSLTPFRPLPPTDPVYKEQKEESSLGSPGLLADNRSGICSSIV